LVIASTARARGAHPVPPAAPGAAPPDATAINHRQLDQRFVELGDGNAGFDDPRRIARRQLRGEHADRDDRPPRSSGLRFVLERTGLGHRVTQVRARRCVQIQRPPVATRRRTRRDRRAGPEPIRQRLGRSPPDLCNEIRPDCLDSSTQLVRPPCRGTLSRIANHARHARDREHPHQDHRVPDGEADPIERLSSLVPRDITRISSVWISGEPPVSIFERALDVHVDGVRLHVVSGPRRRP